MKLLFKDWVDLEIDKPGTISEICLEFPNTKIVTIEVLIEEGDEIRDYKPGDKIKIPGKFTYSKITNSLLESGKRKVDEFIKKIQS